VDLDRRICSRARLSRDARFDGRFYVAVLSTGIYCRPICRARTAKESNVRYFATAAAAAEAGFRPCLRCRPECSPGTPAWLGSPSTVSRALRLIAEDGLDDGGVEMLAERLGIGARHLRRLFVKHLGATPSAVAETRRLHFAKKLIDETRLPMNQIALASGFGSVRRFNAAIRATYHRTPTQIRRLSRDPGAAGENQYLFRLGLRPPYAWGSMLAFLSAHATPGVESVKAGVYRRSISIDGNDGWFEASFADDALAVRIEIGDPQLLFAIVERIRAMFDLNADPAEIARCLGRDPLLGDRLEPGLRVPGCWDGFELAFCEVLGHRAGEVVKALGRPCSFAGLTHLFPTREVLAQADLRAIGVPHDRAEAAQALARAFSSGSISFTGAGFEAAADALRRIRGVTPSTAEWVALRSAGEPDAFPVGDNGLIRAAGLRTPVELERLAQAWRPWRAYAAICLRNLAAALHRRTG
jgi:AraC family transcriptional regulator of adaptative response / DNA-3-methyladenine glycosylase II